jgi:hypothetical protein
MLVFEPAGLERISTIEMPAESSMKTLACESSARRAGGSLY